MKFVIYCISLLIFISCVQKRNKSDIISVDVEKSESFESEMDSVYFIPLENADGVFVGMNPDIRCFDDKLFICNKKIKSIYVFSEQGRYICSIEKKGNAPGEYSSIDDFFINDDGLFIYDRLKGCLFNYTMDGGFVKSMRIEEKSQYAIAYDGCYIFYGSNMPKNNPQINIYNRMGDKIKEYYLDNDYFIVDLPLHKPLSIVGDKLFLSTVFDYNIYTFYNKKMKVEWKFDFGNINLDESFKSENERNPYIVDLISSENFENKILWIDAMSGVNDWILFSAVTGGADIHILFNTNNMKSYLLDKMEHPFDFLDNQIFSNNKFYIGVLQMSNILQLKKMKAGGVSLNKYTQELLKNEFQEEDNPVLVFFKPK